MTLAELSGLVTEEVGEALRQLAGKVEPPDCIVEIGSFKGKSTCYLATGAPADVLVHAVDPWDLEGNTNGRFGFAQHETLQAFHEQVHSAGVANIVIPTRGFSTTVARTWGGPSVGLLYIDGDHREHAVREDFLAWCEHLSPYAIVAFDDLDTPKNPGVRVVWNELVAAEMLVPQAGYPERLAVGVLA